MSLINNINNEISKRTKIKELKQDYNEVSKELGKIRSKYKDENNIGQADRFTIFYLDQRGENILKEICLLTESLD